MTLIEEHTDTKTSTRNKTLTRFEFVNISLIIREGLLKQHSSGAGPISPFESEGQDLDTEVHCDMDQQRRYGSTTTYDNGLLLKPTMRTRTTKVTD